MDWNSFGQSDEGEHIMNKVLAISLSRVNQLIPFHVFQFNAYESKNQFVGRSEHTCGPKAQQLEDSSRIQTHNPHNTCVLEGRCSNQLSHLILLRHGKLRSLLATKQ